MYILPPHNSHNFNDIVIKAKEDTVYAANTATVSGLDVFYRFKSERLCCDAFKTSIEAFKISVGLSHPKLLNTVVVNPD